MFVALRVPHRPVASRLRRAALPLVIAGALLTAPAAVTVPAAAAAVPAPRPSGPSLEQRPFPPTDVRLFTPEVYPASGPMVPAAGPAPGQLELSLRLSSTLGRRCPARVGEGSLLFSVDPGLRRTVPDPNLRAAAVALLCTFGEPAVAVLRGTAFTGVRYAALPPASIAQVAPPGPGETAPNIVVNSRYRNEDFRLLAPVLFHETLHQDTNPSNKEELIAGALDSLVYAQQLLTAPEQAISGTELARRQNTKLMARVNSGPGARLGLFTANGPNVYPGGTPLSSFAAAFPSGGPATTPGNTALRRTLRLIAAPGATPPPGANFDDATLQFIDANQGLSPAEVLHTAQNLRLDTAPLRTR
ncbi:hypothetical protein Pve01_01500 [Planomonospora venezuelensis]|nr:hypothetical protein Pve01_01500 [Planomonospora venezuelensis]